MVLGARVKRRLAPRVKLGAGASSATKLLSIRSPGRQPNDFVFAQFRERGFEFDIAAEGLIDRAHERIENIVADPGQSAKAYQFTGALLRATAADIDEVGMILRQAQLRPGFSESARRTLLAARVDFVGAAVVEQVEFEQLDTLIFEVEERAVEAAPVGAKKAERGG